MEDTTFLFLVKLCVLLVTLIFLMYVLRMKDIRTDIEFSAELKGQNLKFHSTWGLFSPERIDEGTRILIEEFLIPRNATLLDLGCGYGPIGLTMAKLAPAGTVHMVDKDFVAIEYAKKNAEANGLTNVQTYLSNGFSHVPPDVHFDVIASNLPAKPSKELYQILFEDAKRYLNPGGKFYVVVISGLKEFIKRSFGEVFGNCDKLRQGRTHCVFVACKIERTR